MRSFITLASIFALAAAAPAPVPQDIDFDLVEAVPNPSYTTVVGATAQIVSYNPTSVLSAAASQITATETADSGITARNEKRTACAPQPSGASGAPTVSTDSPAAFTASPDFSSIAVNAPVPSGYTQQFSNQKASNNAYGYMGYTTLQTYDVNSVQHSATRSMAACPSTSTSREILALTQAPVARTPPVSP